MSRNVSDSFRRAAYAQETGEVWIALLTIYDENLAEPIRVASDPFELLPQANVQGVVSRGMEFIYLPFDMNLPSQTDTGISNAKLTIENVDRRIIAAVRSATSELRILVEIVLASNVDLVEIGFPNFRMSNVTYDALTIEGDLSLEYFLNEPYPAKSFTPAGFPALF